MIVKELLDEGFKVVAEGNLDREITGCYISDMSSWVMARAESGDAWVTILNHKSMVAVAQLGDLSCVILPHGEELSEDVSDAAKQENIAVLSTELTAYGVAKVLVKHGVE